MLKSVYDPEWWERQVAFKDELSDENFTTAEKNKLAWIEEWAEVNNITDTQAYNLTAGLNTSLHSHNNMYYTENEVDILLSGKQNSLWYTPLDSVVAWANITIDNTDPLNPIINSTWWGWSITDHNNLTNIQWWAVWDYQHLTTAQLNKLNNQIELILEMKQKLQ